jgi:GT2 family glycosyltransferase
MTEPRIALSVVIPTYRRRESLRRLLTALAAQTLPAESFEAVVSIDGSEDGTREMVAGLRVPYTLRSVWQPNRGRAAACNAGLREAQGEVLVLMDDDMEPAPGCLEAHRRAHADGGRRAVVGAMPMVASPMAPPAAAYVQAKFERLQAVWEQPGRELHFRELSSANLSIRREVLFAVGLFDEDFRLYGNEDSELALRLVRAGVRLVHEPAALVRQHCDKDFAALARDNLGKGQTAVLLAAKHPEAIPHLKLGAAGRVSRRWRLAREVLLGLSRIWPATPRGVIALVGWIERRRPRRLDKVYFLALDYFFWLGARPALRQPRNP